MCSTVTGSAVCGSSIPGQTNHYYLLLRCYCVHYYPFQGHYYACYYLIMNYYYSLWQPLLHHYYFVITYYYCNNGFIITVIMGLLLPIFTRSLIGNNGFIITYYEPDQLADEQTLLVMLLRHHCCHQTRCKRYKAVWMPAVLWWASRTVAYCANTWSSSNWVLP